MKKLDLIQMEAFSGSKVVKCFNCGQTIILGGMLGGMFGGVGSLVGAGLAALGPACLNVGSSSMCK